MWQNLQARGRQHADDDMTNTEQLLKCAEVAGHKIPERYDFMPKDGVVYIGDCENSAFGGKCEQYNPETNDAQAMELLKILLKKGWDVAGAYDDFLIWNIERKLDGIVPYKFSGKTLNQAIISAICEVF